MNATNNFLRRLLEAGVVTQDDLERMPTNELRRMLMPGDSGGFVRNETEGGTMALNGQPGGAFDSASQAPSNALAMRLQPPRQPMNVAGYGGGQMSDLGAVDEAAPQIDHSRPGIEIAGKGKGLYGKDGNMYIQGPQGLTKVISGYDRDASYLAAKQNFERRKGEQDIAQSQASVEHSREQVEASRAARTQKEGIPGIGPPQSFLEKQFGRAPDGKRWTWRGELEEIPGGDGGKLTEFQGKSGAFGTRAANAHEIMSAVGADGKIQPGLLKRGAEAVPLVGGALGMGTNWTQSPAQQQVEQAQRDFINATLRQESGAVISPSEFDNARVQYFPQPGDGPDVIAQKKRNRELVIASFADSAGPGKKKVLDAGTKARAIFDAKHAVRRGVPATEVRKRLAEAGITDARI